MKKAFLGLFLLAAVAGAQTAQDPFYRFRYTADGFYAPDGGQIRNDKVYDTQGWLAGRNQNGVWAINTETGAFYEDVVFAPEFNRGRCAVQGLPLTDFHNGVSVAVAADGWIVADNKVRRPQSAGCQDVVVYRLDRGRWSFHGSIGTVTTWVRRGATVVRENLMWLPMDTDPAGQCMLYRISDLRWMGNERCPGGTPTSAAWRVDAVQRPSPNNPAPDFDYYLSTTGAPTPTPGPTQPPAPTAPPNATATPAPSPTPCTGGIVPGPFGRCYDCAGNVVPGYENIGGVCVPTTSTPTRTATAPPTSSPTNPPASPTASPTSTSTPAPSPTTPPTASPVPTSVPPTPPCPTAVHTRPPITVTPRSDGEEAPREETAGDKLIQAGLALGTALIAFIAGRRSAVK